jgi:thiol-disulfide isomerase/thioredoxin
MRKILFFTAPWCAGCKSLKPMLYKLVEGTDVQVEEIDVEERGDEASAYGVTNLPTLAFFVDDEFVSHKTGNSPATLAFIRHFLE